MGFEGPACAAASRDARSCLSRVAAEAPKVPADRSGSLPWMEE